MSNWVTLPNGVHIDLDDPNNPITGDGSFSDLGSGGGSKGSSKKVHQTYIKSLREGMIKSFTNTLGGGYIYGRVANSGVRKAVSNFLDDHPDATNKNIADTLNRMPNLFEKRGEWTAADVENLMSNNQSNSDFNGKDSKSFDRDLELAFNEFDGDEDAILDALRSTGKDYGMSNGDLQAVVESYVMTHGGTSSLDKLLRSRGNGKSKK